MTCARLGVALAKSAFLRSEGNETTIESWLDAKSTSRDVRVADFHSFPQRLRGSSNTGIENLTSTECIDAYAGVFLNGRGPLLHISSTVGGVEDTATGSSQVPLITYQSVGSYEETKEPWSWMCTWGEPLQGEERPPCKPQSINASTWTISRRAPTLEGPKWQHNYTIDYCLSMKVPESCKLHYSLQLLAVVVFANALKVVAMLWTLICHEDQLLITVGDAVSSFLDEPDDATQKLGTISGSDVSKVGRRIYAVVPEDIHTRAEKRWCAGTGILNWSATIILWLLFLATASGLLALAASRLSESVKIAGPPLSRGFGLDTSSFIKFHDGLFAIKLPQEGAGGLIAAVLLVNSPQIVCSLLYFLYNGIVTAMLSSAEWSRYYLRKKALRFSNPQGQQRSTYWLELPYRYSLPFIAVSIALHWLLISQSLFLARIGTVEYQASGVQTADSSDGSDAEGSVKTQAAYSCLPIVLAILLAAMMLMSLALLGFRKLHGRMPVVGSCSLAISAACHRPKDDSAAAYLPVSWGEVEHGEGEHECHCCFTSREVVAPCVDMRIVNRGEARQSIELALLPGTVTVAPSEGVRIESVGIPVRQWLASH